MASSGDAMIIHRPACGANPMSIYEQVLTFIHRPQPDRFEPLGLDVFRHQFATVCAYRRYCEQCGVEPDGVRSVDEVPAVSNVAFKYADLAIDGAAQSPDGSIFLTSGTTQGRTRRGHHIAALSEIYRAAALSHLRARPFPHAVRMASLGITRTGEAL